MTILEKKSNRKKKSILYQVQNGEKSPAFALEIAERFHDEGKLIEADYEELAEYLENLLNEEVQEEEVQEETVEDVPEENIENPINE